MRMACAMLALLVASATVLGLGQGLRRLVDDGFKGGDAATLDHAVLVGSSPKPSLSAAPAAGHRQDAAGGSARLIDPPQPLDTPAARSSRTLLAD
jgi:hypothetical protein